MPASASAQASAPSGAGDAAEHRASLPFEAHLDNVKTMASMVAAIQTQERATCYVTQKGVRLSTDDSHTIQAFAYFQKSLFREFRLDGDLRFVVSLESLLNCLNIFGAPASPSTGNVSLHLAYDDHDRTLQLILHDDGVVTTCQLRTYNTAPPVDFGFRNDPIVNKVIIKSSWLKDAFDEMDGTSDKVHFLVAPKSPYFRISTVGLAGSSEVDYPRTADVIETFQCETGMAQSYRQNLFTSMMKALAISHKTSLRMNQRGFLHLMFMIQLPTDADELLFVEYYLAPVDTDDDGYQDGTEEDASVPMEVDRLR